MSSNPITVQSDFKVRDAIAIMTNNGIDDIYQIIVFIITETDMATEEK